VLGGKAGRNPRWDSVVSGSPGSQKELGRGCLSVADYQSIGAGNPASPGAGFLLAIAINHKQLYGLVTALQTGAQQEAASWEEPLHPLGGVA